MKHCPQCREEYEDWAEACPDCGADLADGPPRAEEGGAPEEEPPAVPEEDILTFPVVWQGSARDGETLAALMAKTGLSAYPRPEEREVDDEAEPPTRLHVPPEDLGQALWFVRGFESAFQLIAEEEGAGEEGPAGPSCCGG